MQLNHEDLDWEKEVSDDEHHIDKKGVVLEQG
jgi:hypothetical protein